MAGGKKPYDWKADLDKIRQFAAEGLTEEQMYYCLGIGHTTFYKYKNEKPEFAEAINSGKALGIQQVSNALFNNAMKGNTTAQIFYLKNRAKDQWKDNPDQGTEKTAEELASEITKSLSAMDSLTKGLNDSNKEMDKS